MNELEVHKAVRNYEKGAMYGLYNIIVFLPLCSKTSTIAFITVSPEEVLYRLFILSNFPSVDWNLTLSMLLFTAIQIHHAMP